MSSVTDKRGNVIQLCTYHWTDSDGHVEKCRAPVTCPVCQQCSRLDGEKELGHCTGHLGLNQHIAVPGNDAMRKLEKSRPRR